MCLQVEGSGLTEPSAQRTDQASGAPLIILPYNGSVIEHCAYGVPAECRATWYSRESGARHATDVAVTVKERRQQCLVAGHGMFRPFVLLLLLLMIHDRSTVDSTSTQRHGLRRLPSRISPYPTGVRTSARNRLPPTPPTIWGLSGRARCTYMAIPRRWRPLVR